MFRYNHKCDKCGKIIETEDNGAPIGWAFVSFMVVNMERTAVAGGEHEHGKNMLEVCTVCLPVELLDAAGRIASKIRELGDVCPIRSPEEFARAQIMVTRYHQ